MLIVCPHCATPHDLPDDFIGDAGRKVRCSSCREIWHAERPAPDMEAAPAPTDAETAISDDIPAENPAPSEPIAKPARTRKRESKRPVPRKALANERFGALKRNWSGAAIAASLCIFVMLVSLREGIVRFAPQMAGLYATIGLPVNLRGLQFDNIATQLFTEGDTKLLVVSGDVANPTGHPIKLPSLRFALRNSQGVEIYSWTARLDKDELDPGESLPFKRRLATPPADGRDVQVRFLRKTDIALLGADETHAAETHH